MARDASARGGSATGAASPSAPSDAAAAAGSSASSAATAVGAAQGQGAAGLEAAAADEIDVPVPSPEIAPKTPPEVPSDSYWGLPLAISLGGDDPPPAGLLPAALRGVPEEKSEDEDEELPRPRPPPKLGKISFNIQGAKEAIAAAQAHVQAEEAVAAAKARRLNTRDASTQTVRDPLTEDGGIVTIWRLRPRGMESFPHFPRARRKKRSRGALASNVVTVDGYEDVMPKKRGASASNVVTVDGYEAVSPMKTGVAHVGTSDD